MRWAQSNVLGSIIFSAMMQLANCAFETVGSVPDLEGCGFLAGGLGSLVVMYPMLSALNASYLVRRGPMWDQVGTSAAVLGALTGLCGSIIYLAIGFSLALTRGFYEAFSPLSVAWSVSFIALSVIGGALGATKTLIGLQRAELRDIRS